MTHLINKTSISTDLIKAILVDAGYNLNGNTELEIEYSTYMNDSIRNNELGGCWAIDFDGIQTIYVKLAPSASTEVLAHELRHAMQFQTMGCETMYAINEVETEEVGYNLNILEVDACEFATRWKV